MWMAVESSGVSLEARQYLLADTQLTMEHDRQWLRQSLADAMGWDLVAADGIVEAIEAAGAGCHPLPPGYRQY
jgi:phage terminase large subunit-like protein